MPETAAATATRLFLAHEEALEQAAAKIYQALTQETEMTPDECFVVCLRAADFPYRSCSRLLLTGMLRPVADSCRLARLKALIDNSRHVRNHIFPCQQ
jgi:hypothetical protein